MHPRRINQIVLGGRSITADTALRIGRALGTDSGILAEPSTDVRPRPSPGDDLFTSTIEPACRTSSLLNARYG